jgi:phage terminase large subunit GpA-like protein
MQVFECPHCDQDFFSDYNMEDVWYSECYDGSYNAYVTLFCPHCQDNVSVPV